MTVFAPQDAIRTVESPQPAIIIGVGAFGQAVLDRIMLQRDVYRGFQTPMAGEDAGSVFTHTFPAAPSSEPKSAADIRTHELSDHVLQQTARDLRRMFNTVRLHRDAPLFDTLRPVVVVVGATWSEEGRALLWPLSAIIRAAIGNSMEYTMYGVFVSADYRADAAARESGEAHTWAVFDEGDRLAAGENIWQGRVRTGIGSDGYDDRRYDSIFWIDSHKENNGSIGQDDDVHEVATHVASLLEGMVYSALPRTLDQALLDDHLEATRQLYIGVGSAALVVPLRDITTLVRRYTLGTIIRDFLIPPDARKPDDSTVITIRRRVAVSLYESAHRSLQMLTRDAANGPFVHNTTLNIDIDVVPDEQAIVPTVQRVSVVASDTNPFDEQLTATVLLERQREAQSTAANMLSTYETELISQQRTAVSTAEQEAGRGTAMLLAGGGKSLLKAEATLRTSAQQLQERAEELEGHAITLAKRADALQNQLNDTRLWFGVNPDVMLERAVALRAHLPAVALRAAIIIALLFQLYWDAARKAQRPVFPMQMFDFTYADPLQLWWPLFLATTLLVGIPALILWVLPYLGVIWQQRWRRKQLERYVRARTDALHANHTAQVASGLQGQLRQQRVDDLALPIAQLAAHRDAALGATSPDSLERDRQTRKRVAYLETPVVDPVDVMIPFQQQVAQSVVSRYGENVVASWRPRAGKHDNPWAVEDIDTMITRLEAQIDPVVTDISTKTIDEYLVDQDMLILMHRLWRSSVPWLKATHDFEATDAYSRVRLDVLMVSRRVRAFFDGVIDGPDGRVITVDWPDAHRVMMLRLHCGVSSSEIARWRQLEAAGERAQRALLPLLETDIAQPDVVAVVEEASMRPLVLSAGHDARQALEAVIDSAGLDLVKTVQLELAVQSFCAFIDHTLSTLPADGTFEDAITSQLTHALRGYDRFRSNADTDTSARLAPFDEALDRLISAAGLEPFAPEVGSYVDASVKAITQDVYDPLLPANTIKRCSARGYRVRSTGEIAVLPFVTVNRKKALDG